jgi:hypothetical protein
MRTRNFTSLIVLIFSVSACSTLPTTNLTPTPVISSNDLYLEGRAIIDTNKNKKLDDSDKSLEYALFVIRDARGTEIAAQTDEHGRAFLISRGTLYYPITIDMEPPAGSSLIPNPDIEHVFEEPTDSQVTMFFSFSSK